MNLTALVASPDFQAFLVADPASASAVLTAAKANQNDLGAFVATSTFQQLLLSDTMLAGKLLTVLKSNGEAPSNISSNTSNVDDNKYRDNKTFSSLPVESGAAPPAASSASAQHQAPPKVVKKIVRRKIMMKPQQQQPNDDGDDNDRQDKATVVRKPSLRKPASKPAAAPLKRTRTIIDTSQLSAATIDRLAETELRRQLTESGTSEHDVNFAQMLKETKAVLRRSLAANNISAAAEKTTADTSELSTLQLSEMSDDQVFELMLRDPKCHIADNLPVSNAEVRSCVVRAFRKAAESRAISDRNAAAAKQQRQQEEENHSGEAEPGSFAHAHEDCMREMKAMNDGGQLQKKKLHIPAKYIDPAFRALGMYETNDDDAEDDGDDLHKHRYDNRQNDDDYYEETQHQQQQQQQHPNQQRRQPNDDHLDYETATDDEILQVWGDMAYSLDLVENMSSMVGPEVMRPLLAYAIRTMRLRHRDSMNQDHPMQSPMADENDIRKYLSVYHSDEDEDYYDDQDQEEDANSDEKQQEAQKDDDEEQAEEEEEEHSFEEGPTEIHDAFVSAVLGSEWAVEGLRHGSHGRSVDMVHRRKRFIGPPVAVFSFGCGFNWVNDADLNDDEEFGIISTTVTKFIVQRLPERKQKPERERAVHDMGCWRRSAQVCGNMYRTVIFFASHEQEQIHTFSISVGKDVPLRILNREVDKCRKMLRSVDTLSWDDELETPRRFDEIFASAKPGCAWNVAEVTYGKPFARSIKFQHLNVVAHCAVYRVDKDDMLAPLRHLPFHELCKKAATLEGARIKDSRPYHVGPWRHRSILNFDGVGTVGAVYNALTGNAGGRQNMYMFILFAPNDEVWTERQLMEKLPPTEDFLSSFELDSNVQNWDNRAHLRGGRQTLTVEVNDTGCDVQ